jgi:hypothetical protein
VLVDVDPSIGTGSIDLAEEPERALGRHVDLVSCRAINPACWKRIEPEIIDIYILESNLLSMISLPPAERESRFVRGGFLP